MICTGQRLVFNIGLALHRWNHGPALPSLSGDQLHRSRHPFRLRPAHIARAARGPLGSFPKVEADLAMATTPRNRKVAYVPVALPCPLRFGWVSNLADKMRQQCRIALLPKQNAVGRLPVTPRPSGFLVVLLDRLGQRQMDNRPHRCLVDPQPEGDGSHQHAHLVGHPSLLSVPALCGLHFPVISDRGDAILFEHIHGLFYPRDGWGIDNDVAFTAILDGPHQQLRLRARVALLDNVAEIWPMEAGYVFVRILQLQLVENVVSYPPGRASGESCDRMSGELRTQTAELPVLRTKFVSPLRNTVGLVNCEESQRNSFDPAQCVFS